MKITAKLKKQIITAASEVYPDEMCGVVIKGEFQQLENVANNKQNHFEISPEQLAKFEDYGEIQAYVHSHPDGTVMASPYDRAQIELHNKPWLICSYPEIDIQVYKPCGYQAPLINRDYHHGWQDCFSIVRDFYERELGIVIPDFERSDKWWESAEHPSLYIENFTSSGFIEVADAQYGDVLICKIEPTIHPNHALIWLGDRWQLQSEQAEQAIGTSLILHHPYNRSSRREIYGSVWQERTIKIIRHKDLL